MDYYGLVVLMERYMSLNTDILVIYEIVIHFLSKYFINLS